MNCKASHLQRSHACGSVTFLFIICYCLGGPLHGDEGAISLSLAISDSEVLEGDSIAYKLLVHNRTVSSVQLRNVNAQRKVHVVQYLESRAPDKEWAIVGEVSAAKEGAYSGNLIIGGKEKFAFCGQFFLKENGEFAFGKPGDYEVRIRVSCLLGEFSSEAHRVSVQKRPASEVASLTNSRRLLERVLSPSKEASFLDEMVAIQKTLAAGATKSSLDLLVTTSVYRKTGKFGEKELDILTAYAAVCRGLDEIRRDMATDEFLLIAHERKAWPELAKILAQKREDSDTRRTYSRELENAIQSGRYRPEKPGKRAGTPP